jgi:hypothetical protein
MKQDYRNMEVPSSNEKGCYVLGIIAIFIITLLVVAFFVWLFTSMSVNYENAIDGCVTKGYARDYCEFLAN